jgi:fibronectin-binding autotransporter adhesin
MGRENRYTTAALNSRKTKSLFALASAVTAACAAPAWANTPYAYTGPGGTASSPTTGNFSTGFGGTAPVSSATTELDFGGFGGIAYTATNDIGPFNLNALNLSSVDTVTETIASSVPANILYFNGAAPAINQLNSGSFNISAPIGLLSTLSIVGPGTGAVTLSGPITGGAGLTFNDSAGTVNLTGAGTYTGSTSIVTGTVNYSGTASATTTSMDVGSAPAAAPAVMNVTTSGLLLFSTTLNVGDNNQSGAVNQFAGTVQSVTTGGNYITIGNGTTAGVPAYGSYNLAGGTLIAGGTQGIRVGGDNATTANGSMGVLTQTGGVLTCNRYLAIGTGGVGVATFTGGTTTIVPGYRTNVADTAGGNAYFNLGTEAGGTSVYTTGATNSPAGLDLHSNAGALSAIVNLNAGTLIFPAGSTVAGIADGNGGTSALNLNGAVIQSNFTGVVISNGNSLVGYVYNGGIGFNTAAGTIGTVQSALVATTGGGIYAPTGTLNVPAGSGGTGYVGSPIVTVSGAGVTGTNAATAIANISNGQITGITLTSPGEGYTLGSTVNFSFAGGGATSVAPTFNYTFGSSSDPNLSNNGTGAVTKYGTGTLVFTGANTYPGPTNVAAGILQIGSAATTGTLGATGSVNVGSGAFLSINMSSALSLSTPVTGVGGLLQAGTGNTTITTPLTYTGPTNIAAGVLTLGPTGSLGNTAVNVLGTTLQALPGTGSITIGTGGASLNLFNGGKFNMSDGAIGTVNVVNTAGSTGLSLNSSSSAVSLTFDLGTSSTDLLAVTGLASLTGTNDVINLNTLGSATSLTSGNYTLISTSGGLVPADFTLAAQNLTLGSTTYHLSLGNSTATAEVLSISQISGTLPTAYWAGSINNIWSTNQSGSTNFRTDATSNIDTGKTPDATTNVVFTVQSGGANLNTVLGTDFSINSLTFNGDASGPVGIGGPNTLTINALATNGNTPGNGINMAGGSTAVTISANVSLGGSQTWTNASPNPLTVSGNVSGASLVYTGSAPLTLSGNNTFSGGFNITSGQININSATALGSGPITLAGPVTIDNTSGAPVTLTANSPQTWNGDVTFNGTSDLNMGTGPVTLGANRMVTLNAGNLSVGGITDNGQGFNLTTAGAGNLAANGSVVLSGSINITGTGGMTINGSSSTVGGSVNISGGGFSNYSGANTTINGTTNVTNGVINITGSANVSGQILNLGGSGANGRGVLNINTTGTVSYIVPSVGGNYQTSVGSPNPAGAIVQNSGVFLTPGGAASNYLELGAGPESVYGTQGGYGSYVLNGGTLGPTNVSSSTQGSGIRVGAQGIGIFTQNGGVVNMTRYFSLGLDGIGTATINGGVLNGSTGYSIIVADHDGVGYLNVGTLAGGTGTVVSASTQAGGGLLVAGNNVTTQNLSTGVLNLNSGLLVETAGSINSKITNPQPTLNATVNLNGGTLQAGANNLTLIDNSLNTGTTAAEAIVGGGTGNVVYLYNGNAVVDSQTNTATISANLYSAPGNGLYPISAATGGKGVLTLPAGTGGAGYIGAPAVFVTGGSGSDLAAVADLSASGTVTGVTITNPGYNYQPGDQITFSFNADGSPGAQYLSNVNGAPSTMANSFVYTVGSSDPNLVANNGGLVKVGTGTLVLSGANFYTGPTNVSAGTLNVALAGALPAGNSLSVAAAASTVFAAHTGTTVIVQQLGTLSLAGTTNVWTGLVDVTNNDLDITSASLATVTNQVKTGYNEAGGANWQGSGGITSSTAAANTSHLTAVGVILNNANGVQLYGSGTTAGLFDKTNPGPNDVLVKYTYFGDANLDGKVDGSDYSLIDAGYASHGSLTGWYYGDFNYDGVVDGSDYTLIDNAFNNQGSTLTSAAIVAAVTDQVAPAAVPEPASAAVLAGLALAGFRRRRIAR